MIPLTDAEKTDVRRYCGYPAYGAAPVGFQTWRFYQVYGLLEFRMNNLSQAETGIARRYLVTLHGLEAAAVWTHNRDETRDRARLFDSWCRRLCGFLGIPAGPALTDGGITLVV